MHETRTPVMDALVEFVLGLETASLPPEVVDAASRSMTDWLGTAIRGSAEPLAEALAAVINATGGQSQSTVVGRGVRTSALLASLANGAQSHALDFDDTHLPAIVHGSAPVAPVVLALGEWRRLSGAEALAAFVAGFEVETRIGRVIGRRLADCGWHVTGLLGHFGAAAAGKLLGLDRGGLAQALGIAATQAAGLEQSFGTMSKPLHPGKAAMNGLLAALLAGEGFTGSTAVLDGAGGLPATFVGVEDLDAALDGLGKRFEILDNSTKFYAACHLTHATIDAARAIRARSVPAAAGGVESVRCHVNPLVLKVADHRSPRTGLEAKFSVAFCAAIALLRGDAGEAEFTEQSLDDPAVTRLMARITAEADSSLGLGAAWMTVRLTDGRLLEERVTAARGTAENPPTREDIEEKFRRLSSVVLPADRVTRLVSILRGLAELADVSELAVLAAR